MNSHQRNRPAESDSKSPRRKQVIGLRWTLLWTHLGVSAIGTGALCIALASVLWLRANTLRIANLYVPTEQASMLAHTGVQHSLAGLRGIVAVGGEEFHKEWSNAWTNEIRPSIESLQALAPEWSDPNHRKMLDEVVGLLEDLDEVQWWIEHIAQTPGNQPGQVVLRQDFEPRSLSVLSTITGMIDAEEKRHGSGEPQSNLGLMVDIRAAVTECETMLATWILNPNEASKLVFQKHLSIASLHLEKLQARDSLLSQEQRISLIWLQREFSAYHRLADQTMALETPAEWDIARFSLATRAIPLARRISTILLSVSGTQAELVRVGAASTAQLCTATASISFVMLMVTLVAAFFLSKRSAARIAQPIAALSAATVRLAAGRQKENIPVSGDRELQELLTSFNQMAASLRQSESLVRDSETRFRSIVQSAADGIIVLDEFAIVELFNPAAERAFGYAADEVIGGSIDPLILLSDAESNDESMGWVLQAERTQVYGGGQEVVGVKKDGTRFPLRLALSEVHASDRVTLIGIVHDLSQRKALEHELAQAQKLESIGQLAAGIAHEINTPTQYVGDNTRFLEESFRELNPLLRKADELVDAVRKGAECSGLADELKAAFDESDLEYLGEEIPRAIEQTLGGIDRVRKIVQSMKEFSHPGGEGLSSLDLNRAIESTITVASSEWKYLAEMETDFDPELPAVPCMPGDINRVILNMIVNAAHSIADVIGDDEGSRGKITISTSHDEEFVEIRIKDTGTGIPVEARNKIFDPFYTTKEVGKGTGQGLSIARGVVVKQHQGTLHFETEIGEGTSFIIRLPLERQVVEEPA